MNVVKQKNLHTLNIRCCSLQAEHSSGSWDAYVKNVGGASRNLSRL